MTTQDLIKRRLESEKRTQDAINKIIEGKTIETYVWVGFFLVVVFMGFTACSTYKVNPDCNIEVYGDCEIVYNGSVYAIRRNDGKFFTDNVNIWDSRQILAMTFIDSCSAKKEWLKQVNWSRKINGDYKPI